MDRQHNTIPIIEYYIHNPTNFTTVSIDPHNVIEKSVDTLSHTNNKWFINLTDTHIPAKVSNLLQLGDRFCLPQF